MFTEAVGVIEVGQKWVNKDYKGVRKRQVGKHIWAEGEEGGQRKAKGGELTLRRRGADPQPPLQPLCLL
jgi:hypothetical protein